MIPMAPRDVPFMVFLRNLLGRRGHDSLISPALALVFLVFAIGLSHGIDWSPLTFRLNPISRGEGRVLSVEANRRMPQDGDTLEIRFSYLFNGVEQEGICWTPTGRNRGGLFSRQLAPLAVGEVVPVEIIHKSGNARIVGTRTGWCAFDGELFVLVGFMIFAVIALFGAPRRGWRGNRLLRSGALCRVELVDTKETRSRAAGGYSLVYSWLSFTYRLTGITPERLYTIRCQGSRRDFEQWAWCLYQKENPKVAILLSELAALPDWAAKLQAVSANPESDR